jgi:ribose transport system permease protein
VSFLTKTDSGRARRSGEDTATSAEETTRNIRQSLGKLTRRTPLRSSKGIVLATLLLFLLSWVVQPQSVGSSALRGMLPYAAILAIIALGQTLVVQQGGIDLSVPGMVSLSVVIVAHYSSTQPGMGGSTLWVAIGYAFAAILLAGLINGLLVSRARVAPIVATIGMNAVLYGVDVKISGGTPIAVPDSLSGFANRSVLGISSLAYLAVGAAIVVGFLVKKTVFGRRFEAVGANARAARAAGIVAGRYQLAAYVGASALYCMAGIVLAGLIQMPSAFQGDTYLMPSIAAVVIGGTSLFGGKGNIGATVVAAIFLTQLQQLVLITGASIGVQYLFQGGAIVVGVGVYSIKLNTLSGTIRRLTGRFTARRASVASS